MSINTISAGQKDWVNIIDNNFTELSKQGETVDLSLQNGWVGVNGDNRVQSIPLANGTILKRVELNMKNPSVRAGQSFDPIAILPNGFEPHITHLIGGHIATDTDGHFQGILEFWLSSGNRLGAYYSPLNGGMGPFSFELHADLLYI